MQARDVMTAPAITVKTSTTVGAAIDIMLDTPLSGLPVVDAHGRLVGILSEGDLLRRSEIGTEKQRTGFLSFIFGPGRNAADFVRANGRIVDEVMTRDPITVTETTPIEEVVALMEKHHIKRVPVLRGEAVIGIVTRSDLLRALRKSEKRVVPAAPLGDDAIGAAILTALEAQNWAPNTGLRVEVNHGDVTIYGTILDDRERDAIKVVAENVPGVKSVTDQLVWIDPSGSGAYIGPEDA